MTPHRESHFINRIGWLRPAVLGANDGIVSTASLILGVAAASADRHAVLVAGFAGLAAGAMSMAAGEYVSVSSQADTEAAGLAKERAELASDPEAEEGELAGIYIERGLSPELARQVARQLTAKDALAAMDTFGLQHRLDEFCEELEARYGLDCGEPRRSNTTEPRDDDQALRDRIAEDNALDVELYQYACRLYEERHP